MRARTLGLLSRARRSAPPLVPLIPRVAAARNLRSRRWSDPSTLRSRTSTRAIDLPGLALGVVRDGEIIYTRTAGETIAGSGQRIDNDTLFKIASNSKAMTTGVLARLVDAGKLRWDDPVTRYLPQFRMHDPWVTREMQVRDLLLHNSGLREGAGDLMFWPEPNLFTRADVIAGLAHLKPAHSFRSHYDYDNLMYVVAGEVAAAAAGTSYEALVRRELFEPLQMSRCQVGEWQRDVVGNVAQPHMRDGDSNVVIRKDDETIPVSTSAAAGGIRCSLDDMLKWVRMWLDADSQWLSPAQRQAVWTPHMPMPLSARQRRWDGSRFNAYGYGWRMSDVDGVLRVAHTGTLAGMYSAVTLLPEKNSGFVFMINGEGSEARIVLNEVLVKLFTAPGERRRVADYAAELARERQQQPQESTPPAPARTRPARSDARQAARHLSGSVVRRSRDLRARRRDRLHRREIAAAHRRGDAGGRAVARRLAR